MEVSAALAARDPAGLELALSAARAAGVEGRRVEEALLQGYLFLGYPSALEALALWRALSGTEAAPALGPLDEDPAGWPARGEEVCRRVYGGQYLRLRERVRALHPELEAWMVTEGYGKVLGRPGLELRVRELCIAALLAVLGAPRQLHAHLRGALNTGASEEQVEEALARVLPRAGEGEARLARATWDGVRARWRAKRGGGATDTREDGAGE